MSLVRFHKGYFFISMGLLAVLVYIAVYVRDSWVRPYGGDFMVVIWLYALARAFTGATAIKTGFWVLALAVVVECLQYFKVTTLLGIGADTATGIAMGASFDWLDLCCYALGTASSVLLDHYWGVGEERRPRHH